MNLSTNLSKAFRDLVVIAVGAVLVALADNTVDLGIPAQYLPFVSTAALFLYRLLREKFGAPPPTA